MISITTRDNLHFPELYKIENKEIVKRIDYQYQRYKVKYTMCLLKLDSKLSKREINLKNFIRYSDEVVNINDSFKLIFFTHTDINAAYNALLSLEKKIIKNYFLLYSVVPFKASIIERSESNTPSEIINNLQTLLFINWNNKNEFIFLETN